jgi:hypothetical protein
MLRARFYANPDDWRPVKFPPPGPAWCTGYAGDGSYSVVVAYVRNLGELKDHWPEAHHIDTTEADQFIFTDRFERPDWWPEGKLSIEST